jgi:peptidyl-prolyl cis-trans isomerase C
MRRLGPPPPCSQLRLGVCAALALAVAGCPDKKDAGADPKVVAWVNDEVITREAFERELARELISAEPNAPPSPEQVIPFQQALLETLVERALLLQAARELSVTVTPEEVDRRLLRLSSDYPADGFDEALGQGRLTLAELKRKTAELLTVEKLIEDHVYARVAATEQELRDYYEAHRAQFDEPEQVRAAQIVVKGLDDARRLQQLLRQGRKFPDLARLHSLSADAKVGGDLGFFPRGVMPQAFDEAAFRLAVGQVSDVVGTEYGFHLFKVLEKRPARRRELLEVRRLVEERVLADKRLLAHRAYLQGLKERAKIRVNDEALQGITAAAAGQRPAYPEGDMP